MDEMDERRVLERVRGRPQGSDVGPWERLQRALEGWDEEGRGP